MEIEVDSSIPENDMPEQLTLCIDRMRAYGRRLPPDTVMSAHHYRVLKEIARECGVHFGEDGTVALILQ